MDVQAYLERLKYREPVAPDADSLKGLHRAHLLAVPFENLSIGLGEPIRLTQQALWDKLIVHKRGGFCYELNGLFAWLLIHIGFEVTYLNARVFDRDGTLGIQFDHLTLMVQIPGQPGRWLADVGFGDSFMNPLQFDKSGEQLQGLRTYRLEETSDGYVLWQRNYDGTLQRQYFFDLQPRNFPADYEASCLYHQTSPQSSFTRGSLISRATPEGRVTLEDRRLIVTRDGHRRERPVTEDERPALLLEHFGVVL